MALPPAADLIARVRQDGPGALDDFAPDVDELADTVTIALWLGIQPRTIYRERTRKRVRRPAWPEPDRMVSGKSPMWKYRTIVIHRAGPAGQPAPGPEGS